MQYSFLICGLILAAVLGFLQSSFLLTVRGGECAEDKPRQNVTYWYEMNTPIDELRGQISTLEQSLAAVLKEKGTDETQIISIINKSKLDSKAQRKTNLGGTQKEPEHMRSANNKKTFHNIWPHLKKALCPDMKPNLDAASRLFQLARDQLQMESFQDEFNISQGQMYPKQQPFTFAPGGWAFVPTEKNGTVTIYMRIWKAANNQIQIAAQKRLSEGIGSTAGKLIISPDDSLASLLSKIKEENRSLDGACIVTAIRDPIEHFLSGYNEIEFRHTAVFPGRLNNSHPLLYSRYRNGTKLRFQQFVADYLSGTVQKPCVKDAVGNQICQDDWHWHRLEFGHIWSMAGILWELHRSGMELTAYLPHLQDLVHTWPQFLAKTCPDLPPDIGHPMDMSGQHESSQDTLGFYKLPKAHGWTKETLPGPFVLSTLLTMLAGKS